MSSPTPATAHGQQIDGVWWMKRGLKSRWNPAETLANVTDLHGSFNTGSIKHNFDIGLELSRETNKNASYTVTTLSGSVCPAPLTGFDCTPVYDPNPNDPGPARSRRGLVSETETDSLGVYAFDSISFGEKFIVNLGLRWDDYSVDAINASGTVTAPVYTPVNSGWDFVNYQVGFCLQAHAEHQPLRLLRHLLDGPDHLGRRPERRRGTGTGNLATTLLDPEETDSFEIGAKANLFNDRLALSGALFKTVRKNAQIQVEPGVYEQAGEAEVQGLELGVSGKCHRQVAGLRRLHLDGLRTDQGAYNNVNVGDSLANTPEHSASLFTTYRVMPKLSLGGGVYYVSSPGAATRAAPAAAATASMLRPIPAWTCSPPTTSTTAPRCN